MDIEYVDFVTGKFCRQFMLLIQSSDISQYVLPWSGEGIGQCHKQGIGVTILVRKVFFIRFQYARISHNIHYHGFHGNDYFSSVKKKQSKRFITNKIYLVFEKHIFTENKNDNIHKQRSSKIIKNFGKNFTLKQCHIIIIRLEKIEKSQSL